MGQEFHVVRCFSCQSFQVQQVKKVNRWSCKLCGEKQSLLKEFGRGSGADCRRHVQKLNAMRGAMIEEQERHTWSLWQQVEADGEDEPEEQRDDQVTHRQVSCWSKYLDTPEEAAPEGEEEENVLMDRQQLHGNNRFDRKRKRSQRWTDRREQDRWTPAQSNWATPPTTTTSLRNTSPPSQKRTDPPSLNSTSKRSLNPALRNTSPPTKKSTDPPSVSTGAVSRWARFLRSDCEEGEEPSVSGQSQAVDGASSLLSNDVSSLAPPPTRTRPLLPVSSMFQSGDDFNFSDEDFLINT